MIDDLWIPGNPKTKGSLDVVNAGGPGRRPVLTDSPVSKRWRQLMAYAVGAHAIARDNEGQALGWPLDGAVWVSAVFHLRAGKDGTVTGSRVGDLDKLARNLLDALQDAGVYADDTQVSRLLLDKVPAGDRGPGVALRVWQP